MFVVAVAFVAAIAVVSAAVSQAEVEWQVAERTIKNYVESYGGRARIGELCDQYTCCSLSETESCSVASMPKDESTLVLPGGETRCIFRCV
jgi:hypothetical protein